MDSKAFFASVARGFRRLTDFRGRDTRSDYWPFAGMVILATNVLSGIAAMPFLFGQVFTILARAEQMAAANPQDWVVSRTAGGVSYNYVGNDPAIIAQMMPDMSSFFILIAAAGLVMTMLVAAATVRRLHDRGWSGKWLLVPASLCAIGLWLMDGLFGAVTQGNIENLGGVFLWLIVNNLIYLITLLVLLIQLVQSGEPTDNRFGPPPL